MKLKNNIKSNLLFYGLVIIIIAILVTSICLVSNNKNNSSSDKLSEAEAKAIAEASCIKGGEALSGGTYNQITKTWWFDANLNSAKEGCNPACVVSEETKTAEINWRCTGLIEPNQNQCGIENCHGLDIVCGPNPAQICTAIYMLGDKCREFAKCEIINGVCQQTENQQFNSCKTCVNNCENDFPNNSEEAFNCESKC